VLETLEPLEGVADALEATLLCEAVYECMPYASLSREFLERVPDLAVLPSPTRCSTWATPSPTLPPEMTSLAHVATLRLGLRRHHAHAGVGAGRRPGHRRPLVAARRRSHRVDGRRCAAARGGAGRSMGAYATIGVATAATLALTLALHEAAHCAVARRAGLGVRRLTLSFLGGALELAEPPGTPAVEARVALAGPLASAGAALLATAAHLMLVAAGVDPLLPRPPR